MPASTASTTPVKKARVQQDVKGLALKAGDVLASNNRSIIGVKQSGNFMRVTLDTRGVLYYNVAKVVSVFR